MEVAATKHGGVQMRVGALMVALGVIALAALETSGGTEFSWFCIGTAVGSAYATVVRLGNKQT